MSLNKILLVLLIGAAVICNGYQKKESLLASFAEQSSSLFDFFQDVTYMEVKPSQIPKALELLKQQVQSLQQSRTDLQMVLL